MKLRALRPGSGVALVAPASPFDRAAFDAGCRELERLSLRPIFDETVFERGPIVAGSAAVRAEALRRAWLREDVDAVLAVRGGLRQHGVAAAARRGRLRERARSRSSGIAT